VPTEAVRLLTHGYPVNGCFICETIVFREHGVATLCSHSYSIVIIDVRSLIVKCIEEGVNVGYDLVDERLRRLRYLLCYI
jgi:hypothetical protein